MNIENFKPLQDFVLIKTEPVKLETESGIIMKIQNFLIVIRIVEIGLIFLI